VVHDLLRFPRVVVPYLENLGVEPPYSVMSPIGRGVENAVRHVELEVWITDGDKLFDIPGVQRGEGPLDQLDGRRYRMHARVDGTGVHVRDYPAVTDLESGYERRIGRYGPSLAREFLSVCGLTLGQRVLDVGAGTGALTVPLAQLVGPEALVAVDPDSTALALCRERAPGVATLVGTAEDLPFADGEFDAVMAQLVVGLMQNPPRGVAEMRRVAVTGGLVATCVWDFGGGMTVLRSFWDAAAAVREDAREHDQALTRPFSTRDELEDLLAAAGLVDVKSGALEAATEYSCFEDLWEPMLIPDGAPGRFLATVSGAERDQIRSRLLLAVGSPDGPFALTARAWYALGRA